MRIPRLLFDNICEYCSSYCTMSGNTVVVLGICSCSGNTVTGIAPCLGIPWLLLHHVWKYRGCYCTMSGNTVVVLGIPWLWVQVLAMAIPLTSVLYTAKYSMCVACTR